MPAPDANLSTRRAPAGRRDGAVEALERTVARRDGARYLRPDAATVRAFRSQYNELDLFPTFATVRCPLLVCAATQDLPGTEAYAGLLAAHRRGIERDLAAAAAVNPCLRVERVAASHGMVHVRPDAVATMVRDFLG